MNLYRRSTRVEVFGKKSGSRLFERFDIKQKKNNPAPSSNSQLSQIAFNQKLTFNLYIQLINRIFVNFQLDSTKLY